MSSASDGLSPLLLLLSLLLHPSLAQESNSKLLNCDREYKSEPNGNKGGDFSTPAHPNDYPQFVRCRFVFRAMPQEVVYITWHDFRLEDPLDTSEQCLRDYVEVIVTDYQNQQHVSGRYCGKSRPPNLKTMQQSVDVIFQSSYTKHYRGFSGTYKFLSEESVDPPVSIIDGSEDAHSKGCGGFAQGKHGGELRSPGYPDTFPGDADCYWVIRVDPSKQIYVKILELELTQSNTECEMARLQIIDGYAHLDLKSLTSQQSANTKQLIQFCGEEKYYREEGAKSWMSDRNRMIIRFHTTTAPTRRTLDQREHFGKPIGFRLVWTEVEEVGNKKDECSQFLCGGGDYCTGKGTICTQRKRLCIHKTLVCDGSLHCAESDESDEENCYSFEIIAAGSSVFLLLVLIIILVICCQRKRNFKEMRSMKERDDYPDEGWGRSEPVDTMPNGRNRMEGKAQTQKREQGQPPFTNRELTALPQNYHGYGHEHPPADNPDVRTPFLPQNHVDLPATDMSTGPPDTYPPPDFPIQRQCQRLLPEDESPRCLNMDKMDTGPVVELHQRGVWEQQQPLRRRPVPGTRDVARSGKPVVLDQRPRSLVRQESSVDSSEHPDSRLDPRSTLRSDPRSDQREMMTFSSGGQSLPLKPILKSGTSSTCKPLPPPKPKLTPAELEKQRLSLNQDRLVETHLPSLSQTPRDSVSEATDKDGYPLRSAKSVGFAHIPTSNIPQPLLLPPQPRPPLGDEAEEGEDRSPSPWHYRAKPTEV